MTGRRSFAILGIAAAICAARLCTAVAPPAFDVASVKISNAPDAVMLFGAGTMDAAREKMRVPAIGGNVNLNNWSLRSLILAAWDLGTGQLSGPDWLGSARYDIAARTSPQATQADLRVMLQSLLAERFKRATHRETKDLPVYALVAAKSGQKLHTSGSDEHLPVLFAPPARLIGKGSTMQALALALGRAAGRPVVDRTGIGGAFDFSLTYSADDAAMDAVPSIFIALQEQLGLRLEPEKTPMEVLVVDRAERIPAGN